MGPKARGFPSVHQRPMLSNQLANPPFKKRQTSDVKIHSSRTITLIVYNLAYFLNPNLKRLVPQTFYMEPFNIILDSENIAKFLNLEWCFT